jgi:hypothetical protein
MADQWSEQQLRHFIRIRDSMVKTGFSQDVAEAQARRAVARRREPTRRSAERTKDDLYRLAMRYQIPGRSKMDTEQLRAAVEEYELTHADA